MDDTSGMKTFTGFFFSLLLSLFVFPAFGQSLKSGDLVFQLSGFSEFSNAIAESTSSNDATDFVHAGIIYIDEADNICVIEASPDCGVVMTPLSSFLGNSVKVNENPGVIVKRLTIDFLLDQVLELAFSHLGEPYDWYYLPDNGKMYCTELIYECFLTENGEHIFKSNPMNFRGPDGEFPQFWIDLFKKLGTDIPEGIPGTNPNDLSRDSRLVEVFRYF